MQNICGFIVFCLGALAICFVMVVCGYLLGGRSQSSSKHLPFESGIDSFGNTKLKFSVKFYLVAVFFVIFDVESLYLYVWSISVRESGWLGFFEVAIFIFVLLLSLMYLIRIGTFDWAKSQSDNDSY